MTAGTIETASRIPTAAPAPVRPEPGWCGWGPCAADKSDGSQFHMSPAVDVPTDDGTGLLDVRLIQLDDENETGTALVSINAGTGLGRNADLTPEQALVLIEVLREHILRAAGPAGVEMPIERVRLGDEIQTANGWDAVEVLMVDGWCCGIPPKPEHLCHVRINTEAHDDDDQAHDYALGDMVRVRAVAA